MVLKKAKQFRKLIANYVASKKVQLKFRPNETSRIKVKCKAAKGH